MRAQTHVWQPLSKRVGKLEMHPASSTAASPSPALAPPAALVAKVLGGLDPAPQDARLLDAGNGGAAVGVRGGGERVHGMVGQRPWTAGGAAMPRGAEAGGRQMERQMGRQMDKQMRPMTPLVSARMQEKGAMQEKDRIRPKTALARYRQVCPPPLAVPPLSPASEHTAAAQTAAAATVGLK